MLDQADDMSDDIYPHGAREHVSDELSANNRDDLGPNGANVSARLRVDRERLQRPPVNNILGTDEIPPDPGNMSA